MIWLVHFIYSAVGFALCYNYVILNYCIRFAVLPCVRLCLNSCLRFVYLLFTFLFNCWKMEQMVMILRPAVLIGCNELASILAIPPLLVCKNQKLLFSRVGCLQTT